MEYIHVPQKALNYAKNMLLVCEPLILYVLKNERNRIESVAFSAFE